MLTGETGRLICSIACSCARFKTTMSYAPKVSQQESDALWRRFAESFGGARCPLARGTSEASARRALKPRSWPAENVFLVEYRWWPCSRPEFSAEYRVHKQLLSRRLVQQGIQLVNVGTSP